MSLTKYQAEASLSEKEEQRAAAQTELDDMLMVFGDVEEKAEKYKVGFWIRFTSINTDSDLATTPGPR